MENEIVNVYLFYLLFFQDKNKTKGEHFITSTWWWMFFNCSFWFVFHFVCTEGYCISIIHANKNQASFTTVPIIRLLVKLNQTFPFRILSRATFFCVVFVEKNQQLPKIVRYFVLMLCTVYMCPFLIWPRLRSLHSSGSDEYRMRLMSRSWHLSSL